MTLLLFITTALCFVAWIRTKVQLRTTAFRCNNAEKDLRVTQTSYNLCVDRYELLQGTVAALEEQAAKGDKLQGDFDEITSEIVEYVLDGADFDLVDAIIIIRHWRDLTKKLAPVAEAVKAERQLQYERALEWRVTLDKGVETLVGLRRLLRQDGQSVVTTKFVDEFITEHLPAETAEPEE